MLALESVSKKQLYKILDFPKHLQVTLLTLIKLGSSTATDVSAATGKARAVESSYLNQLYTLKMVLKKQNGRKALFTVDLEALDW